MLPNRIWLQKKVAIHSDGPLATTVLTLLAVIALLLSRATAAVHPVPLDKNVNAAKCLEYQKNGKAGNAPFGVLGQRIGSCVCSSGHHAAGDCSLRLC